MAFPWTNFGVYSDPLDDDPSKRKDWCLYTSVIIPHSMNWLLCSVHAIACHAATISSPFNFVFPEIRHSG